MACACGRSRAAVLALSARHGGSAAISADGLAVLQKALLLPSRRCAVASTLDAHQPRDALLYRHWSDAIRLQAAAGPEARRGLTGRIMLVACQCRVEEICISLQVLKIRLRGRRRAKHPAPLVRCRPCFLLSPSLCAQAHVSIFNSLPIFDYDKHACAESNRSENHIEMNVTVKAHRSSMRCFSVASILVYRVQRQLDA
jgi:hypothetical protein